MKQLFLPVAAVLIILGVFTAARFGSDTDAKSSDEKAIEAAVMDYVEALYKASPERIGQSVDTTLRKIGFYKPGPDKDFAERLEMTYDQLEDLSSRWNAEGQQDLTDAPKEIVVLDHLDKTASAKLVAAWGIDYFHLAKVDDTWKIFNVIWQSHPEQEQ